MTQLTIVTTPTNSGDGTPLATAFNYCNSNFSELYARFQVDPPASLTGTTGDFPGMYAVDSTYFYYCYDAYDGSSTIWGQVTQVGNISVSSISSGTSNVKIADINGNATTSIAGTSNVVVVAGTGQYVTGLVSATGNITGNYILGNGSQLTGLPQSYSNSNVVSLLSAFGSNVISTTGTITSGNITGGNLLTNNIISATGNITTSGFFLGDFIGNMIATISNLPGPGGAVIYNNGSGNAAGTAGLVFDNSGPNVLTVLGAYSATGGITATGNITGGNVSADNITGTLTTVAQNNITSVGTLSSVTVTANVAGGNLTTGGQVSATGNIRTANYLFVSQDVNVGGDITSTSYTGSTISLSGNVTGGNVRTGGLISATGNITGNYIFGNGSQLTNLITNTIQNGNSNVLVGSSGGNVSINVNGISPILVVSPLGMNLTGNLSATLSITGGNVLTGGIVSATGEITGANVKTNGFVSATGNVTGGNILFGSGNVSGSGNVLTGGQVSATGNITTSGTLEVINNNGLSVGLNNDLRVTIAGQNATIRNQTSGGSLYFGVNVAGNVTPTLYIDGTNGYVYGTRITAQYADLAENYTTDADYAPGTVVVFGGEQEITTTNQVADERVAGVISTNPAYLMNSGNPGLPVALRGKVPVQVVGPVNKGDSLVTSSTPGVAISVGRSREYAQAVFAKSLETDNCPGEKIIQAVIL